MKKFFLTLAVAAMAFTACNDDDDDKSPKPMAITASGIENATNVTTVKALAEEFDFTAIIGGTSRSVATRDTETGEVVLATGTFASNAFTLSLPGTPNTSKLSKLLPVEEVPEWMTITNEDVKVFIVNFPGYDDNDLLLGNFSENVTTNSIKTADILRVYADGDCKLTGTTNTGNMKITLNLDLARGWNRVALLYGMEDTVATITAQTSIPTTASWVYAPYEE